MRVVGGRMIFKQLTSGIEAKKYAVGKAVVWLKLLNDGMKPVKWLKPTKRGTKVDFEFIRSDEEWESELERLNNYINEVNQMFGTDLKLNRQPMQ
jgi:hypothetical protein